MSKQTTERLEQLHERIDEAKQALLTDAGMPCRGRIYPYQRGNKRYYKWQRCEGGKRTQRTVGVEAMEALLTGIASREQFEERLEGYYAACEAYVLASAQERSKEAASTEPQKKTAHRARRNGVAHGTERRRGRAGA